jgi:hypothetical protein
MCGDMVTEKAAESKVPGGDYLELYKMLHEERVSLGEEARKLEIAAITAVAALYAWLATHDVHGAPWYIGVPLVMLAAFRAIVLGERMLFIKEYLMFIEQKILRDKCDGYENYFSVNTKSKWYMHIRYTVAMIWIALLCVTVIAPSFLRK